MTSQQDGPRTIRFGYTLSSEEHGPRRLVANARQAEERGFDFVSISDHFHPWVEAQGHSPFVWSVLGAISGATDRIEVGVGVTCPIVRIHPAILAQATATASLLLEGRFVLGVGTGEALNERDVVERFERAAGSGPTFAQLNLCWADDEAAARRTVREVWPNAGIGGQLSQDLPTWTHFEQAAEPVSEDKITESVPCGPDVDALMESVQQYLDAGYDHLYFHQIGPDQDAFFDVWSTTLQARLAELTPAG